MKKILFFSIMVLALHSSVQAATVILSGALTTRTLTADNCYYLQGCVTVPANVVLTINPGVEIRCESGSSLTIEQGGTLNSNGTSSLPVVFTSDKAVGLREPGDWVGITINGYAKNNVVNGGGDVITIDRCTTFPGGGANDNDNSGSISYTRIEFAGQAVSGYNYTDALVLNGVGSTSSIEGLQITQCAGNGITILGGMASVSKAYILDVHKSGIYISDGYTGPMQSLLVQTKDLNAHDASGTYALYLQNNDFGNNNTPLTRPVISNASLLGPLYCDPEASLSNNFQSGIYFTNNGGADIYNSVITGFRTYGLYIQDAASAARTADSTLNVSFCSFTGNGVTGNANYQHESSFVWSDFGCTSSMPSWIDATTVTCEEEGNQFDPINLAYNASFCDDFCDSTFEQNFVLDEGTTGLLDPDYEADVLAGFTQLTLRGAIQATDWLAPWIEVCPKNAIYCVPTTKAKGNIKAELQFVPNPAGSRTQVQFSSQVAGPASLYITDKVTGRVYYSQKLQLSQPGEQRITLPTAHLREGIYTVRIVMKDAVQYGQLVVQP